MVTAQEMQELVGMRGLVFMPFSSNHLDRLQLNDPDIRVLRCFPDLDERLHFIESSKMAWTIFYDGKPALSYGFEYKWDGMLEAWLLPGRVSITHGTLLSRGSRRLFDKIGPHLNLRRLQIVVDVTREPAVRWAEFLKFKREGVMQKYGPEGNDYYMYARTY
jgi:hypothetical protein